MDNRLMLAPGFPRQLAWLLVALWLAGSPTQSATPSTLTNETQCMAVIQSATASVHEKGAACRQLAVLGTSKAVPALAALLPDPKLSHLARFALEPMPDPAAGEALRSALPRLHGALRVGVINSLGVRRDTNAVEPLSQQLRDADAAVATAAAAALGRIGTVAAGDALQQALTQPSANLRPALAEAGLVCAEGLLAGAHRREAIALYDALRRDDLPKHLRLAAVRGAILARQTEGGALLLEQLRSPDADRLALAWRVARELPGREVTLALAGELARLPVERQVLLVQALGDRGDAAALPTLLEMVQRAAPPARVGAIRALSRLADASSVPVLLEAAAQNEADVAQAAQTCLNTLSAPGVEATLVDRVSNGPLHARRAAIHAVAQRRVHSAVPALLRASREEDAALRHAAIKALGETVEQADFRALASLVSSSPRGDDLPATEAALAAACLRLPDKGACAETLLGLLPQAGAEARRVLLQVLSQAGGDRALQAVRTAAQDPDAQVRAIAVRALTDWADLGAAPDLLAWVRTSTNSAQRTLAFRGYVRLAREAEGTTPEVRLQMLTEAMAQAQNVDERKLVLGALGDAASAGALEFAVKHLAAPELANEAGAAVVKITAVLGAGQKKRVVPALQEVQRSATAAPVLNEAGRQLRKLGVAPAANR